jgi:cobaltochelatase CobS
MSTPLARTPLTGTHGIVSGRRLKLGDDYIVSPTTPVYTDANATRQKLTDNGYKGDTSRLTVVTGDVVVPSDSWGVVVNCDHYYGTLEIIFVFQQGRHPVAVHMASLQAERIITSRGAPPMVGESYPAPSQSPTTPAPAIMSPAAPVASGFDALIAGVVSTLVESRIAELEAKVASAAAPAGPSVVHVRINQGEPRPLSAARSHAMLGTLLTLAGVVSPVTSKRLNIMMVGPAGTGKTMLANQVAEAFGVPFGTINGSAGVTEGKLLGTMTPNLSTGEMIYQPSELVKIWRDGGVYLLDEIDANDENVLLSLNNLIDNTKWQAPNGDWFTRSPDAYLISNANTFGLGANRIYSGRTQLDAAFLDRWLQVEIGYDLALDRSICANSEIVQRIHAAREVLASRPQIRRWLTMRGLLTADALVGQAGYTVPEALKAITQGWTVEDRQVCGL